MTELQQRARLAYLVEENGLLPSHFSCAGRWVHVRVDNGVIATSFRTTESAAHAMACYLAALIQNDEPLPLVVPRTTGDVRLFLDVFRYEGS